MPEANEEASSDKLIPESDWVTFQGMLITEDDQAASQETPKQVDDKTALQATLIWHHTSSLLCQYDSGEDVLFRPLDPKEETLAHCTVGCAMFGPCWPGWPIRPWTPYMVVQDPHKDSMDATGWGP